MVVGRRVKPGLSALLLDCATGTATMVVFTPTEERVPAHVRFRAALSCGCFHVPDMRTGVSGTHEQPAWPACLLQLLPSSRRTCSIRHRSWQASDKGGPPEDPRARSKPRARHPARSWHLPSAPSSHRFSRPCSPCIYLLFTYRELMPRALFSSTFVPDRPAVNARAPGRG